MSLRVVSLFVLTIVMTILAENVREKRWIRNAYTEVVRVEEVVTQLVPSSCIHVEPTLVPCRYLRNLRKLPNFVDPKVLWNPNLLPSRLPNEKTNSPRSSSTSWLEYLGLIAPTITHTVTERVTTSVMDPSTVVTFSLLGCRPTQLPLDLDRCPSEIRPSATMAAFPTRTTAHTVAEEQQAYHIEGNSQFRHNTNSQDSINSLHASYPSEEESEVTARSTERLNTEELILNETYIWSS